MSELLENRADLALTSLKITTERNLAIDFSIPLMETGIALIVALRPGAISTTAFLSKENFSIIFQYKFVFLEPYDYRIWILILIVTLHGVAIMVFLFDYFRKRYTTDIIDNVSYEYLMYEFSSLINLRKSKMAK
jgi:ionotropic glutamate receptor NMDA 2B